MHQATDTLLKCAMLGINTISVSGLLLEQSESLEALKAEIAKEERVLCDEFVTFQESAAEGAAAPLVDLDRRVGVPVDGKGVEDHKEALLWWWRKRWGLSIDGDEGGSDFKPGPRAQTINFLDAIAEFQLDLRIWAWEWRPKEYEPNGATPSESMP
ncbi:hypothetical protein Ancab_016645 [Ancistrocladus abbreviatus]